MAAAFFDMDRTVLTVNTGTMWVKYLHRRGEISRWQLLRALGWILQYKVAMIDLQTISRRVVGEMAGSSEDEMIAKCRAWYASEIEARIARRARATIDWHRKNGEHVVLLTSATRYVAEPLAATLGLDGVLCTRLEVDDGRFTGRVVEPLCFGVGKVTWAERWAGEHGVDLAATAFYTDSYTDLAMLERVGTPVVVNPDLRLSRHAKRKGWRMEEWS